MQPDQPFMFAKDKMLHINPICWTNEPELLSETMEMPVETIAETQKTLLYQSLLNSVPAKPFSLQEYEQELEMTAFHLRNIEKSLI